MTRHWSMGARLTLWYSLVLLAGLALFGVSIWVVVNHRLMATIDESLAAQAKGVTTVLQSEYEPGQPGHLKEELSEYVEATPDGRWIEVRDPRGTIIIAGGPCHDVGQHFRPGESAEHSEGQRHCGVEMRLGNAGTTINRQRDGQPPAQVDREILAGLLFAQRDLCERRLRTQSAQTSPRTPRPLAGISICP